VFFDLRTSRELGDAWAELMQVVKTGDTVRVVSLDRLSRVANEVVVMLSALQERGIMVEVLPPED
jgi:DNA invertase Pin-like site-specific DNA recombinase